MVTLNRVTVYRILDLLVEGLCSPCLKKARGLQPFSSTGSSSAPTSSMQS
jgi:hypothetical protein